MTDKDFLIKVVTENIKTTALDGIAYSGVLALAVGVFSLAFYPTTPPEIAWFGLVFGGIFSLGIVIDWMVKFDHRAAIRNAVVRLVEAEINRLTPLVEFPKALVEVADNPNRQVNAIIPSQAFLEWVWNSPKTPTEGEARIKFPGDPTGEWFSSLASTGHLQGRSNHGKCGIKSGTLDQVLKRYGYSAKPASANEEQA